MPMTSQSNANSYTSCIRMTDVLRVDALMGQQVAHWTPQQEMHACGQARDHTPDPSAGDLAKHMTHACFSEVSTARGSRNGEASTHLRERQKLRRGASRAPIHVP